VAPFWARIRTLLDRDHPAALANTRAPRLRTRPPSSTRGSAGRAAAKAAARSSAQLARVAFAGALTGIAGMVTAIVMIAAATSEGVDADPVVSRAVTTASAGPFLVSAMGFAALLMAAGLLTLRTGVFGRWTGFVALLGAVSFRITFLTLIAGAFATANPAGSVAAHVSQHVAAVTHACESRIFNPPVTKS
jgi:hypothetical protein